MTAPITLQASVYTYAGTTAGAPVFNRPMAGTPPTALSGVLAHYHAESFQTDRTGIYAIGSSVTGLRNVWDNFLILYSNSFSPTAPFVNAMTASSGSVTGLVGFTATLTAGVQYYLVTTGDRVNDYGSFRNTVAGLGRITGGNDETHASGVPEPSTFSMLLLAGGAATWLGRRRV